VALLAERFPRGRRGERTGGLQVVRGGPVKSPASAIYTGTVSHARRGPARTPSPTACTCSTSTRRAAGARAPLLPPLRLPRRSAHDLATEVAIGRRGAGFPPADRSGSSPTYVLATVQPVSFYYCFDRTARPCGPSSPRSPTPRGASGTPTSWPRTTGRRRGSRSLPRLPVLPAGAGLRWRLPSPARPQVEMVNLEKGAEVFGRSWPMRRSSASPGRAPSRRLNLSEILRQFGKSPRGRLRPSGICFPGEG